MGFNCSIVGMPNVGKSTLFNALTKTAAAQAANFPFCTIEPNVGEVPVPDHRLDKLAAIAGSKQIIPTRITFVDIAGLVKGASKGEGLGNQFLANIREVDAIAHVLRCFQYHFGKSRCISTHFYFPFILNLISLIYHSSLYVFYITT